MSSPEEEALIRGVDDHRVLVQSFRFQILERPTDVVVNRPISGLSLNRVINKKDSLNGPEITLHIPLILERGQLLLALECEVPSSRLVDQHKILDMLVIREWYSPVSS